MDTVIYTSAAVGASLYISRGYGGYGVSTEGGSLDILSRVAKSIGLGIIIWFCAGTILSTQHRFILADTFIGVIIYSAFGCAMGLIAGLDAPQAAGMEDPDVVDAIAEQDQPIVKGAPNDEGVSSNVTTPTQLPTVGQSPTETPDASDDSEELSGDLDVPTHTPVDGGADVPVDGASESAVTSAGTLTDSSPNSSVEITAVRSPSGISKVTIGTTE
jgi:hypothetical protein